MSVRVMSLVWDKFKQGGSEKLVMLAMADWCNDEGLSLHPSHEAVAVKCCISRSQAQRVIRSLVDGGWLEVVGNQFGGAPGTTKKYRMCVEKLRETGSAHATGSADATGSTHAARRVAPRTETGSTHATQTTIEPPITTSNKQAPATRLPAIEQPSDVDEQVWQDWLQLRKAKRAPVTKTVINSAISEAAKAGLSLNDFLKVWCARGSQGLEASWIKPNAPPGRPYESEKDRGRREVFEVLCGGKQDDQTANERDITGIAERVG